MHLADQQQLRKIPSKNGTLSCLLGLGSCLPTSANLMRKQTRLMKASSCFVASEQISAYHLTDRGHASQGSATAESTCESLIVPVQFGLVADEAGAASSAFRVE
jgi:hypothetical protein